MMKGKTYLKVTGILLLIGGIIGVLCYGLLALLMGWQRRCFGNTHRRYLSDRRYYPAGRGRDGHQGL